MTKVILLSDGYLVKFPGEDHFTVVKNDGHTIPIAEIKDDGIIAEIVAARMINSVRVE